MMLIKAIDIALKTLELNKLCRAVEDDEAYYFTGCGDNGEPIFGCACCQVEKKSLRCTVFYHDDPDWETPKTAVSIPHSRKSVNIERDY